VDSAIWNTVEQKFRQTDIDGAIAFLEGLIAAEKHDRFGSVIGAQFTNPPEQVLAFINRFIYISERSFRVKAIYLEMNAFDINCDLWFFSPFGYKNYDPDPDDLDWLSDWQSEDEDVLSLRGLESLQADFAWYCEAGDSNYARVQELAGLLVMAKFVALVRSALSAGLLAKAIPVLATAHDFDIVGRFMPPALR
jgi:hypothetical protein